ncbi:MAG: DUF1273 domain-containing protein [Oscillospiraceae bacterium]|nr:DUF1273 domain-containing protein [Oscillospiraceae bacterium]
MIDKLKVACFSGHRRLPRDCGELRSRLRSAIVSLIEQGVVFFGAGGALGFDMLAEETVLELKGQYPHIKLILVLPCPAEQQTLKWNSQQRERYYGIHGKADKIRTVSPRYTPDCMLARNRCLVDNSAHLVCYLRQNSGGTFYTVNYAENRRLNIIRL